MTFHTQKRAKRSSNLPEFGPLNTNVHNKISFTISHFTQTLPKKITTSYMQLDFVNQVDKYIFATTEAQSQSIK
jgi:hypothetical protein